MVGTLYKNPFDCLWKTLKIEGPFGLYKGSTAHFLRIAPHTYVSSDYMFNRACSELGVSIITLTANDLIINLYKRLRDRA